MNEKYKIQRLEKLSGSDLIGRDHVYGWNEINSSSNGFDDYESARLYAKTIDCHHQGLRIVHGDEIFCVSP